MKKHLIAVIILLITCMTVFAQTTIKGVVKSAKDKTPLPGVSVVIKGTTVGSSTDIDGKYSIKVDDKNAILVFSFIGMKTKDVKVGDNTSIDVLMEDDVLMLKEAVVLGYGSVKSKEAVVGSVEQVKAEDLKINKSSESFDKMLEGMVAGVYVDNASGEPGSAPKIRIRGQGSLDKVLNGDIVASSEPLYVIDGVPLYDSSEPNAINLAGTGFSSQTKVNPLSLINPDDIETITVLKDASAAAIYGANASNGVILITTKKGKKGKPTVAFNQTYAVSEAINPVKFLNTEQYVDIVTETFMNLGWSEEKARKRAGRDDIYTDWQDLVLRTGTNYKANLSISGGSENVSYRFSGGYDKLNSISEGNDMERISTRMNMNINLSEKLTMTYIMGFSTLKKNNFNVFGSFAFFPNLSPYNEDGSFNSSGSFTRQMNPLAGLAQNEDWSKSEYLNGSVQLKYNILEGLNLSTTLGVDYTFGRSFAFRSKENGLGRSVDGAISDIRRKNRKWLNFTQLDYTKVFADIHKLSGLIGFQIDDNKTSNLSGKEDHLPFEKIRQLGMAIDENSSVRNTELSQGSISYYGRVSYSLYDRYHVSANYRRDASSVFGGDSQKENFASLGASWIISKESFMSSFENVDLLKLKLSYGTTGNSRIGSYAARGLYRYSTGDAYNGLIGATPSAAPNSHLSWEKNKKLNIGIELGLYSRISMGIEFYQNNITDAIMSMRVPYESGFADISANVADMKNRGLEISLRTQNLKDTELKWITNFNIAFNKNKVTRLANKMDKISESSFYSSGIKEGRELGLIFGAVVTGVNPETGAQTYRLPDGSITEDAKLANSVKNRQIIGNKNPDFQGGITNSFLYKNFNLSFLITYDWGADLMLPWASSATMSDGRQVIVQNQSVNILDRWQKPGDITNVPKLSIRAYPAKTTTRFKYDKSNINFKSLSFGYNLPENLYKKLNVSGLALSANVSNIWTWYKEGGKSGRNGIAEYRYPFPQARTVSLGLDVKF